MKTGFCKILEIALRKKIFLLFLLSLIPNLSSAKTFNVVMAPMPIYSEMTGKGEGKGLVYELIQESAKAAGLTPRLYFYPLKRTVHMFVNNKADFMVGSPDFVIPFGISKKEIGYVPIMISNVHLFYYKPNLLEEIKFERLSDFNQYLIGLLRGVPLTKYFANEGVKTYEVNDQESAFLMLKQKRIDFFATTPLMGRRVIQKLFPEDVKNFSKIEKPVEIRVFGIILKKSNKRAEELGHLFQKGLKKIIKNKRYESIFKKYWKNKIPVNTMLK